MMSNNKRELCANMNDNVIKISNAYIAFCNALSDAYSEQDFFGYVSPEKARRVSDTFGDIYSKFVHVQPGFDSALLFCIVISKMNDYNLRTGNSFDFGPNLFKIIFEKVTGGK